MNSKLIVTQMILAGWLCFDSKMASVLNVVVAVALTLEHNHFVRFLRDKLQELEPSVEQHGPCCSYLPCWPLLYRLQWFFSICCVDFETKFSLGFQSIEGMLPSWHVLMSSGTWMEINKIFSENSLKNRIDKSITF